ncbi:putative Leucine-rich repeat receptor-like protein kinase family protein [Hibiscus syriacus]|uniref:Leucine-rich repeat receptor-like protein kinase family protein n=1 Tax=Hibiscus syriacus TaxID=106335 RepID=A0A6A2YEU5_HIBSY|nr:receptor-like protein 52 [Hibiscus syriacus]KAE8677666.1 putative Leucine-rich repeat receptor-like protein kinase family protein [Hibiscus syriacus]
MVSSFTNPIVLWVTILVSFAATAEQSPLESKAKALLTSGWWNGHSNDTSQPCNWPGISCNPAGSITQIYLSDRRLGWNIPPGIVELSALEYLGLSSCALSGNKGLSPCISCSTKKIRYIKICLPIAIFVSNFIIRD